MNIFQVRKRPFHWSLSKYHVRFWAALWFSGNYNISIIFSVGFSRIWSKFETGFNEMAHNWDLTFRIQSLSGSGFSEKWILTILSNFLSTDKLTNKKSWAILQNFNSWMIKLTNTLILPNYQVPNCYLYNSKFYHSRIEVLRNCSAFFSSVSLVRGNVREWREFIFHEIRAQITIVASEFFINSSFDFRKRETYLRRKRQLRCRFWWTNGCSWIQWWPLVSSRYCEFRTNSMW